jgi:hypothetical protein
VDLSGRFENNQSHRRQRGINALRVNRVSMVDHESVRLIAWDDFEIVARSNSP